MSLKSTGISSFLKLLSSFADSARGLAMPIMKGAYSGLALFLLWLVVLPAHAQAPAGINLRLHKEISAPSSPAIGDVVTYTVVVANAPGSTTATNVSVTDELPVGGVTYVPGSASTVRGNGTFTAAISASAITGTWTIPSIAPGDSAVLVLRAAITNRGVWFNTAEVTAADQTDSNSIPNNHLLTEDDYDAVCFSVPLLWYVGDEYTITVPAGYDQIVWSRNGTPISTTAVSTSLAVVNSDFSLTIKSPGIYSFVTYRNGCQSGNCCDVQLIQGPYGSLGDYVFIDSNKNGAQNTGEPGIPGVKVYLYDQTGTAKLDSTVTDSGGKYLFDSLTDGSYVVQFIAPTGYQSTTANAAGLIDSLDSDAGTNGFTGVYTIDTSQPNSSTLHNNPTVDAGFFVPSAGLGDFVFVDINKNGIQDAGEPGIPGVTVTLYTNGVASLTTLTNASGLYSFTGLTPGSSLSYSVGFTAPAGYTATLANQGADDAKDSDADVLTGRTQSVTLANGEFNPTLDAGFFLPSASLGDFVFVDTNKDGIQQPGEPGIPGVIVTLISNGTVVASTTTNGSGLYSFTGLTPGVPYSVSFTTPTGYTATLAQQGGDDTKDSDANPVTGQTRSVTLAPGENNPNLDAGFYLPTAGLGDFVFVDINKNGIQDAGEPGIAGVTVTLYTNGVASLTTLTNASGLYSFTGLTPGTSLSYSVGFTAPAGYTATLANQGADDAKDSDADVLTGRTQSVTLANGEFNPTLDAGFYLPSASLGDFVFVDTNKDGVQQPGEPGIPGVTVTLISNGTVVASTTTNGSGVYSFTGLTPGVPYSVSFTTPTGYTATLAQQGGDDTKDSDANPVTGQTRSVTLAPGENNPNLDAGFYLPRAGLGDFVFVDINKNGIQDAGEPGIAGVTVTLYTNGVASLTTLTNASGLYSFTGLTPGSSLSYSVGFTAPAGYTATLAQQGGNDALDSDANPVTGITRSVTLAAGEFNPNLDAGYTPACLDITFTAPNNATICNGDSIRVTTSTPLSGAKVCYYLTPIGGTPIITVDTDVLVTLKPTTTTIYYVEVVVNGCPSGRKPFTITVTDCAKASLGDFVFVDTNKDGIQQPGEPGIPGVIVTLISNGTVVASTTTNASGLYSFTGLTPGVPYSVSFTTPAGFTATLAQQGGDDTKDSDANPVTGQTRSVTLAPGENNPNLDAGFFLPTPPTAGLGDYVFVDNNGNGIQDGGDTPLSGVVVTLYVNGVASATTVSNASGFYSFTGLTPGSSFSYSVGFTTPTGFTATLAGQGSDATDSDVNPVTGRTRSVTLAAGEFNPNLDAGYKPAPGCNVQPPVLVCAITEICKGGTTILSAEGCEGGTVKWSDGKSGATIFATPSITTTYNASCVIGNCISVASNSITVVVLDPQVPTITASADNVCPGTSVTLTASGCVGGTIEWSDKAQIGVSIVVTPYGKTTYTAQCRLGGCLSSPAVKTINITSDIPTPTIVCSTSTVCPGETMTLTVVNCVGTPVWNSTTATTTSIVVTPTVGNNTYTVYCKNGACVSKTSPVYTVNIVAPVIPTVTASADTVCAKGAVVLTAADCNGTVVWSSGQTGPSITVYPTANISYFAQCKYRTCLSAPSNTVTITVVTPTAPIVSASKTLICSGEKITLTAKGCAGTVQWHGIDRVGASIDIYPTATTEYYATCKQGACESDASNKVRITVNTSPGAAPVITASTLAICNGGLVSLTATGCDGGTVKWSDGQTGSVVSVTATPTNHEFYALCMPTSSTGCGTVKSNVININVTPTPTPTIVRCLCSNDTICPGEKVKFTVKNCQGTPYWSTNETTTSIIVSPTVTTSYTVYCQDGVCKSTTSAAHIITVIPVAAPTITASATVVAPGSTVTLSASGCAGTVIWSANDINGNNKGASIVVRPEGTQTYYAQCQFHECLSEPSITITINPGDCTAKAGTLVAVNGTVCGGTSTTVTIAATPSGGLVKPAGYSVLYVLTKGADKVIQQTSATPQFSVSSDAGDYTIHTLVYNANASDKNYLDLSAVKPGITTAADVLLLIGNKCAALDGTGASVHVRIVAPPILSAGPSLTVCSGGTVSLTATGCAGGTVTWSDGTVGATYTKAIYSDQTLTATCTVDGCTSQPSTSVHVTLGTPVIPIIVSDKYAICVGETVSLTATGCAGGTYIWSDGTTVGNTLTITPTTDISYRVKCKVGTCEGDWSAYTTIKVGTPSAPTISIVGATNSTTTCFGAPVTLVAAGCSPNSYVTWSNNLVGTSITVSLASSATFTARCCNSNTCKSVPSNEVTVTVLPKVSQPTVVDKTNTCPFITVDLATAVTSSASTAGGVFEYYTDASLSSGSKVANPAAVGTGTYYVVERTVNGCAGLPVAIHVQINPCTEPTPCDIQNPATANAGPDASICASKTYQLNGTKGGAGQTAHWTTSGSGSFDNSYALNAIYTASAEDILSGKVTLTLSVSTNNAACPVATDDLVLTINGIKSVPVVTVVGATNLCYGDSVTLKAPAGAAGYKWSNNATTSTIVVKTSGVYNVQLFDVNGCSSVKSDDVVVKVAEPLLPPLVTNLRNVCPSKIVDLTKALSSTTAGSSYIYRICECVTSNIVIRPDSVCEGNYWIVEKNAFGCVSAPSKVVVKVFNCASDTLGTDVSIAKTVSTAFVQNGAPVTYTITVSNAGPHTAKNIDVRDVLPKGLVLIPGATPTYTVSNGIIKKHIDSLKAGQSAQIVFAAHVTVKGQDVVNKAEITYLDNQDTNPANNTASVTVKDTSTATRKASLVGLAKAVHGVPQAIGDSLMKVSYSFVAKNFGDDTLRNVKVGDDLAYAFAPNTVQAVSVTLATGSTLKANSAFTGVGTNTQMLDSTSYILPGTSQTFVLDITVKRAAGDTTKSFNNLASVSAHNSLTTVSDLSTSGVNTDPDNDGDPTNNTGITSFTLGVQPQGGPGIGLALAVVKIEQQPDSSYNVTYKATIKNVGDVALKGVVLTDSLLKAFASPASYSVVSAPVVGAGSTLVANAGFNGNTQSNILTNASQLAIGVQDTVLITVNIKTNGNNGPFYSSATVVGHTADSSVVVKDISNNGFDPAPAGSVSTTVRFDLPKGLLGVAKSVGTPTLVETGVYDIPYTITLSNMGTVPLKKVQVVDNLSQTFGHGALIVSNRVHVTGTGSVLVDSSYTGQGLITKMLVDSLSTLAVGAKSQLSFTVRVDVKNADSLTFLNTASATALTPANEAVTDVSTTGINSDPDNDLDPRNNSQPTPVALNGLSTTSYIGLAMTVRDTARQADGSFNVTYQIVVKNYGPDGLKNVSISDTLSKVFNSQTGSTYSIVRAPFTTSTGSVLKLNPNFNGGSDPVLVLGDSTSSLAAGKTDTLRMVVNVSTDGSTTTFLNTAYGQAIAKTGRVSDVSTSGLNPDLNGNNNPTDSNEREATPLNLPQTFLSIFIPEGFSPNGDGINDLFVIRGANGLTMSLEVYNRWGNLVYKNDDYHNDWNGKPNTGIAISSDSNGLPDGTYYYVINTSDGRKFVRYMTINR